MYIYIIYIENSASERGMRTSVAPWMTFSLSTTCPGRRRRLERTPSPRFEGPTAFVSQCGILHGGKKLKTCAWNNIIYIQRERVMHLYFWKNKRYLWFNKYLYYLCICTCNCSTWKKATDQWNLQHTCNYLMAMIVKQLQTSSAMAAAEVTLDEGRLLLSNFGSNQEPVMWCKCCHLMVLMCSFGREDAIPETWLAVGMANLVMW